MPVCGIGSKLILLSLFLAVLRYIEVISLAESVIKNCLRFWISIWCLSEVSTSVTGYKFIGFNFDPGWTDTDAPFYFGNRSMVPSPQAIWYESGGLATLLLKFRFDASLIFIIWFIIWCYFAFFLPDMLSASSIISFLKTSLYFEPPVA